MRNNTEATLKYRAATKAAFARYALGLRVVFAKHGRPIPVTPLCGQEMTACYVSLLHDIAAADVVLNMERGRVWA